MKKVTTGKRDHNGVEIFQGDILTGLYIQGNPDGKVVLRKGIFSVKDCDGDLLDLIQVIDAGCLIKQSLKS